MNAPKVIEFRSWNIPLGRGERVRRWRKAWRRARRRLERGVLFLVSLLVASVAVWLVGEGLVAVWQRWGN